MKVRKRTTFALVGIGLLVQSCGNSTEATKAAVGTGAVVAASGINRAVTKDCWARCSPGYLCNQKTGLCEPGECLPACPAGYSCTVTPTETRCIAHGRPLFDPVTEQTRVDRYGPRGSMGAPDQNQDYRATERNAARNDGGQVALPRRETTTGATEDGDENDPQDARKSGGSEELRASGAQIFEDLDALVPKWRTQIDASSTLHLPPPASNLKSDPKWTAYAETLHRKVHGVYSDGFLGRLATVSKTHALQNAELRARVALVIEAATGNLRNVHLLGSSDSELFDIAVLESLWRAAPFPLPPTVIVASDGHTYVSWELHRHIDYACSSSFLELHLPGGPPAPRATTK